MDVELDHTVYPDEEAPSQLVTPEQKADYVHRICSAFDFGIAPEKPTVDLFVRWRDIFDRFPHPAFHAFRAYFGWEPVERRPYFGEPGYCKLDRGEDREDPCESLV